MPNDWTRTCRKHILVPDPDIIAAASVDYDQHVKLTHAAPP
jgi:hypothetical protein